MDHTTNYQLSQWVKSDQVKMEDFNADNAKIDAVLGEHAAALAGKGSCTVETFTYTGNGQFGQDHPNVIRFRKKPSAVIIASSGAAFNCGAVMLAVDKLNRGFILTRGASGGSAVFLTSTLSWGENQLSFFHYSGAAEQLNGSSEQYFVIAFYSES